MSASNPASVQNEEKDIDDRPTPDPSGIGLDNGTTPPTPTVDNEQGIVESAYIPVEFYFDFLLFLKRNEDIIRIITYDDLAWGDDFDHVNGYPGEKAAWMRSISSGEIDNSKIYVLIQHDVDSRPERTMFQVEKERELDIKSNIMIFNNRIDRRHLRNSGLLSFTSYEFDRDRMRYLEDCGFVIAYHSNAFEQSGFDMKKAQEIFEQDVHELRKRYAIRYFSAHGGEPSPDGLNNRDVPIPPGLVGDIRWVHNGATPWFSGGYSDGGLNSPNRDPRRRDLRDFVRLWKPGGRYRVLTHPQYYDSPCRASPRMKGTPWYDAVRTYYSEAGKDRDNPWRDVAAGAATRGWPGLKARLMSLAVRSIAIGRSRTDR